ncbi:hypothetical protein HDF22_004541 [Mucilaginibacter lappiensis]|uniref:Uncharacterized protein n=1 Tax=Mucilaginibacter lappiensis TaxID=354630 RepID=A0A841JRC2_9SPHI|nr:hypothetical protein [Mucilaginibacter lappiensis]
MNDKSKLGKWSIENINYAVSFSTKLTLTIS